MPCQVRRKYWEKRRTAQLRSVAWGYIEDCSQLVIGAEVRSGCKQGTPVGSRLGNECRSNVGIRPWPIFADHLLTQRLRPPSLGLTSSHQRSSSIGCDHIRLLPAWANKLADKGEGQAPGW